MIKHSAERLSYHHAGHRCDSNHVSDLCWQELAHEGAHELLVLATTKTDAVMLDIAISAQSAGRTG